MKRAEKADFAKHCDHRRFLDLHNGAFRDGDSIRHAPWLAGEAPFTKKIADIENGNDRLPVLL